MSFLIKKIDRFIDKPSSTHTCLRMEEVTHILKSADEVLREQASGLIRLVGYSAPPFCVVGALHGNFYALRKVFEIGGPLPYGRYIFLGNLAGEGGYSVEIMCYLLACKVLYPLNVFILRSVNDGFDGVHLMTFLLDENDELDITERRKKALSRDILRKYGGESKLEKKFKVLCDGLPEKFRIDGGVLCANAEPKGENFWDAYEADKLITTTGEQAKRGECIPGTEKHKVCSSTDLRDSVSDSVSSVIMIDENLKLCKVVFCCHQEKRNLTGDDLLGPDTPFDALF